jgi:hypothetical protein
MASRRAGEKFSVDAIARLPQYYYAHPNVKLDSRTLTLAQRNGYAGASRDLQG